MTARSAEIEDVSGDKNSSNGFCRRRSWWEQTAVTPVETQAEAVMVLKEERVTAFPALLTLSSPTKWPLIDRWCVYVPVQTDTEDTCFTAEMVLNRPQTSPCIVLKTYFKGTSQSVIILYEKLLFHFLACLFNIQSCSILPVSYELALF